MGQAVKMAELAVHGGEPVRREPMPPRFAVGPEERKMIEEALAYYQSGGEDPGYQGHFEERYCRAFAEAMDGGYADAVATGTAALYVALAALDLPQGGEVLVSPITDPGTLSAIILNRLVPRLADSAPGSYNMGVDEMLTRLTPGTCAVLVVHAAGRAAGIDGIVAEASARGLRVIEDCSQAHGARHSGQPVGTFGDIAAFSTMYRKAHITGGCGGVVFTRDRELYRRALAHADRGKPRWRPDFDDRDPTGFLFPALNLHADELSCAIGLASLERLPETIRRRTAFVAEAAELIETRSAACRACPHSPDDSPFFHPVLVDADRLSCTKRTFAEAVRAEGIGLNPHYQYVVCEWPWVKRYLADGFDCPNARDIRDRSFNLYLNENYGRREAEDIAVAIAKVEDYFVVSPGDAVERPAGRLGGGAKGLA
ncbi:MAG: DegT/DnrJ/EryC1/StrS family aminotransferase [Kiloniellales bacterium]